MTTLYLDHAAAGKPEKEILDFYFTQLQEYYGNQEAGHSLAYQLRKVLQGAGKDLSNVLLKRTAHVEWCSCGSSAFHYLPALNLADGIIITTKLEHPALLAALKRCNLEICYVNTPKGQVDLEHFQKLLRQNVKLIAIHQVQSELGVIQPWDEISVLARKYAPEAWLLTDSVQAIGKLPLPQDVDFLTVSGHKCAAPGGGALLTATPRSQKFAIPLFQRQRHEYYLACRPDVPVALTLTEAIRQKEILREKNYVQIRQIHHKMRQILSELGGEFLIPESQSSPYILHVLFRNYQSGVLVRMLAQKGVMAASGSACQAEAGGPSAALLALGLREQQAYSGLRLSFSLNMQENQTILEQFPQRMTEVLKEY